MSTLTPDQQHVRDTHNMDTVQLREAFGVAMRKAVAAASKPTGGRRNKYIAALLLAESKGIGFLELDRSLFNASDSSMQVSFNAASEKHHKPRYVVYEHPTGRKLIFCPTHPMGNESFTRWTLMVDHGLTKSEINALSAELVDLDDEFNESEATETWVTQVIDDLYGEDE